MGGFSREETFQDLLKQVECLSHDLDNQELQFFLIDLNNFLTKFIDLLDLSFTFDQSQGDLFIVKPLSKIFEKGADKVLLKQKFVEIKDVKVKVEEDENVFEPPEDSDSEDYDEDLTNCTVKQEEKQEKETAKNEPEDDSKSDQDEMEDDYIPSDSEETEYKESKRRKRIRPPLGYKDFYNMTKEEYNSAILAGKDPKRGKKGSLYICPKCDKEFIRRVAFESHLTYKQCLGIKMIWPKFHIKGTQYFCLQPNCPDAKIAFDGSKIAHNHHYDIHAPQAKLRHKCQFCPKGFTFLSQINAHYKEAHRKEMNLKPTCICKFCGKAFFSSYKLKLHENTHKTEKPYKCDKCENSYNSPGALLGHTKSAHIYETVICPKCGKQLQNKQKLAQHMKTSHGDYSKFMCNLCGKKFKDQKTCNLHETKNCKIRNPHKCPHCEDFETMVQEEFVKHVFSHQNLPGFPCDECGKTYKTRENLRSHKRYHMEDKRPNVQCPMCDKDCRDLVLHKFRVHGVGHQCPDCPKKFPRKLGFDMHRFKAHGGPRPTNLFKKHETTDIGI